MGEDAQAAARKMLEIKSVPRYSKGEVTLKAPIFNAQKVICVGMNYVDHCTEQGMDIPKEPIIWEEGTTEELDFEVEMVIVIGKGGRAISAENAMKHVVGYTVAHDVSARDWQLKRNGGQWF